MSAVESGGPALERRRREAVSMGIPKKCLLLGPEKLEKIDGCYIRLATFHIAYSVRGDFEIPCKDPMQPHAREDMPYEAAVTKFGGLQILVPSFSSSDLRERILLPWSWSTHER